MNTESRRRLS